MAKKATRLAARPQLALLTPSSCTCRAAFRFHSRFPPPPFGLSTASLSIPCVVSSARLVKCEMCWIKIALSCRAAWWRVATARQIRWQFKCWLARSVVAAAAAVARPLCCCVCALIALTLFLLLELKISTPRASGK